jgi:ABC-type multidrug transport system fused ATPase/permease subunit
MTWHDKVKTGEILASIGADTVKFQDGIGPKLAEVIQTFVGAILSVVVAFVISWKLTLVMLAPCAIAMGVMGIMGKLFMTFGIEEAKAYLDLAVLLKKLLHQCAL